MFSLVPQRTLLVTHVTWSGTRLNMAAGETSEPTECFKTVATLYTVYYCGLPRRIETLYKNISIDKESPQ